jgi:hypothetical protein
MKARAVALVRASPWFEASIRLNREDRHYKQTNCYPASMTTVDILFRYATPPTESMTFALANTREVYGIRRLTFDRAARTLRVEYDATRLDAAAVTKMVRQAGLDIEAELSLIPQPAPEPAPAN